METIRPNIRVLKGANGRLAYYVAKSNGGKEYRKSFNSLEEAEEFLSTVIQCGRVKNFNYPLDLLDALFGNNSKIDIDYIEAHIEETLPVAVGKLTEREQRIFWKRWKEGYTLEAVGGQEGITRERVRQIEAKTIRKLRHPSRLYVIKYGLEYLQLKDDIEKLTKELEQVKQEIIYKLSHPETIEIKEEDYHKIIKIEDLDLTVRTWNCLTRAGIKTLEDLKHQTVDNLSKIRNLGRKSLKEIITKLEERGIKLVEENKNELYIYVWEKENE